MKGETAEAAREAEIERVRREETARGARSPYDSLARQRRQEARARLEALLARGTEQEFEAAIIARGLRPGSEAFSAALRAFRAERQRRRTPA